MVTHSRCRDHYSCSNRTLFACSQTSMSQLTPWSLLLRLTLCYILATTWRKILPFIQIIMEGTQHITFHWKRWNLSARRSSWPRLSRSKMIKPAKTRREAENNTPREIKSKLIMNLRILTIFGQKIEFKRKNVKIQIAPKKKTATKRLRQLLNSQTRLKSLLILKKAKKMYRKWIRAAWPPLISKS